MKRYIVGLGEALWDVLPEGKKLGGAPANFAYHAAQFGLDTIAISALGEDKLAEETIEALKEHNLNYLMPRVPYPTGTVQVTLTGDGIPTYDIKENVAWDNIPFDDDIAAIARNYHCWSLRSPLLFSQFIHIYYNTILCPCQQLCQCYFIAFTHF
jgi:fructokinase